MIYVHITEHTQHSTKHICASSNIIKKMDTISEIIKSINSQNEALKIGTGLNYLQGIASTIGRQQKNQFDLGGLKSITDIARSISQKTQPINLASMTMGNVIQTMALPNYKKYDALYGLTESLAAIARISPLASNNLSSFAVSRLSVASNLSEIAKVLNQPYLREFNPINSVIKNISNSFIQSVAVSGRWEDISVAEEANNTIANITGELINNTQQVTLLDLDNLKQSIVNELYELHSKTSTEKARQFIVDLITMISFLLTFYSIYKLETDISNKVVLSETKKEFTITRTELSKKIEFELSKLNKMRIARKDVYLKYSCKKKCKIIGLVKAGQQVTVIEIVNKYLLISYIDFKTGELKSGFVTKKYFDIE